jgi:hypothetical protein
MSITSSGSKICKKARSVSFDQFKNQVKSIFGNKKKWEMLDESNKLNSEYMYIAEVGIGVILIDIRLVKDNGKYDVFVGEYNKDSRTFSKFDAVVNYIDKRLIEVMNKLNRIYGEDIKRFVIGG